MKPITLALLTGLAAFGATARADHTSVRVGVSFGAPTYVAPAPAYVAPAPDYCPPATVVTPVRYAEPARGYWRDVSIRTWVPGRWVVTRDRFGRECRVFEEGRYAFRTDRVWVDARPAYGWRR